MTGAAPVPRPVVVPLGTEEALAAGREAGVADFLCRLNVFRTLLHRPALAKGAAELLLALLGAPALDPRLRELVIMRLGWTTSSAYEWAQHWHIATDLGLDPADVLGVRDPEGHPGFGPLERAVLRATDECRATGVVADPTMAVLRAHLDDGPLIELVAAIGAWSMVSMLLRSLGVELEEGLDLWPPDGLRP